MCCRWRQEGKTGVHVCVCMTVSWNIRLWCVCMCMVMLRCPLTIESADQCFLSDFLSCSGVLSWSCRRVERKLDSKAPYVHSPPVRNHPASNTGSWCFTPLCSDPWPSLNPDLWWATWQTVQTSRLSWQTQTRFGREIITDPQFSLWTCSEQPREWRLNFSVISACSKTSYGCWVSCHYSKDKMRVSASGWQTDQRWKREVGYAPWRSNRWQVPEIKFSLLCF